MADITDGNDNDVAQHSPAATAAAAGVIIKPKKPKSEAWHAARKNRVNIQFLQHMESLKSYKEIHGHCNVTIEENPALHRLCVGLRDARRKVDQGTWKTKGITVDNDRIALLDAIGFDWNHGITTTKKGLFDQRITELIQYKTKHGHLNVTFKDKEKSLYHFCMNIRNNRIENKVDEDSIAALDAIGFIWNVKRYQRQVEAAKEAAKHSQQPTPTIAELAALSTAANSAASLVAGAMTGENNTNTTATIAATITSLTTLSTAATKGISIYWSSSEAAKLFGFPVGTDVYHSLQDRIDSLEEATLSVNGYKQLLLNNNKNNNNEEQQPMTEKQIFKFRHQCLFLRTAYQVAIEKMGIIHNNFKKACCEAMTKLNSLGFDTAMSANTIMEWNKDFRTNNGKFSHPNNKISSSSSSKMKSGHNKDDNKNNDDTTNTLPENNNNEEGLIAETEEAQDGVNKKRKAKNINLWSINERERMRMKMKANTTYPPPNIG